MRCSSSQKKRCNSQRIAHSNNANEEKCKALCDENERCNFLFSNTGNFCALFETCDEFTTSKGIGSIFGKDNCPGIMLFIFQERLL